ncbi:hypothetical protein FOA52_009084, partial [Chlamydomonas sp. UWO 241]
VAGAVAVSLAGGPRCGMWMGRPDKTDADGACMPDDLSTLPSPCVNATQAVDAFAAMGFSDPLTATVVLNGAHAIGNSHSEFCSKGIGAMTEESTKFSHHYFTEVVSGIGNAGWFDSDRSYAAPDAPTLPLMTKFAESNAAFLLSWCNAYQEMSLLGVNPFPLSKTGGWIAARPAPNPCTRNGDCSPPVPSVYPHAANASPSAYPPHSRPDLPVTAPDTCTREGGCSPSPTSAVSDDAVASPSVDPAQSRTTSPAIAAAPCNVDVVYSDPVPSNEEWLSTLDLYVSNTGDTDILSGWAYTLSNPSYVSVNTTDAWNVGYFTPVADGPSAPAMGTFAGTASQTWQSLSAGGVNTVNIGVMVSSRGSCGGEDEVVPTQMEINGERCKFGRVRPLSSLDPEWGTPLV